MEKLDLKDTSVNVSELGRTQSLISGTMLLISGINNVKDQPITSTIKALIGGYLVFRSVTGHCYFNQVMEKNTKMPDPAHYSYL